MRSVVIIAAVAVLALSGCVEGRDGRSDRPAANAAPEPASAPAAEAANQPLDPQGLVFVSRFDGAACRGPRGDDSGWRYVDEAEAIRVTGGARRDGGVLRVGRASFRDKPFETYEAKGVKYHYLGRLRGAPVEVVHAGYYEWETWTLVDARRGAQVEMLAPPVPSPDGRAFAGTGDDAVGESFNGVEVVDFRDGRARRRQFDGGFPCDVRWIDADSFEVKLAADTVTDEDVFSGKAPPTAWRTVRVVRTGDGWRMIRPAA